MLLGRICVSYKIATADPGTLSDPGNRKLTTRNVCVARVGAANGLLEADLSRFSF